MEPKQIALKLLLDQIGEATDITSVEDRLRIQKAVYLAQVCGINLGYHYSWYVKGPYSPDLTQDYYKLNSSIFAGDTSYTQRVLNPALSGLAQNVRDLLRVPDGLGAPIHMWYEVLASLHFLVRGSRYTVENAKTYLNTVKPHLNAYLGAAEEHLRGRGLIVG